MFNQEGVVISDGGKIVLIAKRENGLFIYNVEEPNYKPYTMRTNPYLWHQTYAHLNSQSPKICLFQIYG